MSILFNLDKLNDRLTDILINTTEDVSTDIVADSMDIIFALEQMSISYNEYMIESTNLAEFIAIYNVISDIGISKSIAAGLDTSKMLVASGVFPAIESLSDTPVVDKAVIASMENVIVRAVKYLIRKVKDFFKWIGRLLMDTGKSMSNSVKANEKRMKEARKLVPTFSPKAVADLLDTGTSNLRSATERYTDDTDTAEAFAKLSELNATPISVLDNSREIISSIFALHALVPKLEEADTVHDVDISRVVHDEFLTADIVEDIVRVDTTYELSTVPFSNIHDADITINMLSVAKELGKLIKEIRSDINMLQKDVLRDLNATTDDEDISRVVHFKIGSSRSISKTLLRISKDVMKCNGEYSTCYLNVAKQMRIVTDIVKEQE